MHWRTIRELYQVLGRTENPAGGIELRRHPRPLPRVPSKNVLDALLVAATAPDTIQTLRDRLMAELAYGSGLRRGELARLDIEDIDQERRTVYVRGKGDRTRIVPLTGAALSLLREYLHRRRATRGPLFVAVNAERRLSLEMLGLVFRSRFHTHAHALRHACASQMLANGCDLRHIQELLGHRLLCTTQRYTHIIPNALRTAIGRHHPRARSTP
jgi:site-specific recombinase XerD